MMVKRHLKKGRSQTNPEGGIVEKAGTIAISNVMVVGKGGEPVRREKIGARARARRRRPASTKRKAAK